MGLNFKTWGDSNAGNIAVSLTIYCTAVCKSIIIIIIIIISACGLHLEDNAIRVAVGLRLSSAICETHTCPCGATVDSLGQHALSCRKNPGRVQRHAQINDLIHRALIRAEIPSSKEPLSLSRDDGKRPDGLTLVPWHSGHSATWDVTVVHMLAASYVAQSAVQVFRPEKLRRSQQRGSLPSTAVCHPAIFLFRWLSSLLAHWRTTLIVLLQRLAEE